MAMVNMKRKPGSDSDKCCEVSPGDEEAYPYGLELSLDNDTLETLGIKELPAAGATMELTAKVRVTGTNTNEKQDGAVDGRLSLQITDMELGAPSKGPDAGKLYDKDKK